MMDSDHFQYPIMEHFFTLQGEGYYQGRAAYFIRLAGCDIGCVWCDVKESWDARKHKVLNNYDFDGFLQSYLQEIVVVTGGEPAIYQLEPLTSKIHSYGLKSHIETSGAYPITGDWDWICISPKKFKKPVMDNLFLADEFKVIINHPSDFEFGNSFLPYLRPDCKLYIQPEWSKAEQMLPKMVEFVKQNCNWSLSLQIHKFLNIP